MSLRMSWKLVFEEVNMKKLLQISCVICDDLLKYLWSCRTMLLLLSFQINCFAPLYSLNQMEDWICHTCYDGTRKQIYVVYPQCLKVNIFLSYCTNGVSKWVSDTYIYMTWVIFKIRCYLDWYKFPVISRHRGK